MKQPLIITILALLATNPASAEPIIRTVNSEQQASRDNEKLNILKNEIVEQKQLAAELQQQRAIDLTNGNKEALVKTEARLEEVSGNITQIQQEISLAQGSHNKAAKNSAIVRLTPLQKDQETKIAEMEVETPKKTTEQWWDLYNKKKN